MFYNNEWHPEKLCYCRKGFVNTQCSQMVSTICHLEMIDPPLMKAKSECKFEDSEYYTYSVRGFDPCFFIPKK